MTEDRKEIAYYFTCQYLNDCAALNWPDMIRVTSVDEAVEKAKGLADTEGDLMEMSLGCLTVFDDGDVSYSQFSCDDLGITDDEDREGNSP